MVKSLININNIYGELSLTYVEDFTSSQILIAKDDVEAESVYYALNRSTGTKHTICPELNPKTIRSLFETLAEDMDLVHINAVENDDLTLHQFLVQHSQKGEPEVLMLKLPDLIMVVDEQQKLIHSTVNLHDELIAELAHIRVSDLGIVPVAPQVIDNDCSESMHLARFKWQLGASLQDRLFNEEYQQPQCAFQLVSWPDFGELPFTTQFIRLSSMLRKHSAGYADLLQHSEYPVDVINQFLNASILTGNVIVTTDHVLPMGHLAKKQSRFLNHLKRMFKFI